MWPLFFLLGPGGRDAWGCRSSSVVCHLMNILIGIELHDAYVPLLFLVYNHGNQVKMTS